MKQRIWQSEKTRLYNAGFAETDKTCPDCGCFVWQFDLFIPYTGDDGNDDIVEEKQSCPCCGWESVTYDA